MEIYIAMSVNKSKYLVIGVGQISTDILENTINIVPTPDI